ncbi:MAG: hypothetical protein JKY95_13855, partial [Planctomycetaceae bacterium]|nr:hypothetical protein [Planctomycetaceae bacterium]
LVADKAGHTDTLSHELLYQACSLRDFVQQAHDVGQTITVMNPACPAEDCFTDRWPGDLKTQSIFLDDLNDLVTKVEALVYGNLDLPEMQAVMSNLFGENPTMGVFKKFNEDMGKTITSDSSYTNTKSGSIDIAASGLVGAGVASKAQASDNVQKAKSNTFFGGDLEE